MWMEAYPGEAIEGLQLSSFIAYEAEKKEADCYDAPEQPEQRRLCFAVAVAYEAAKEEAGCSDAPEQAEKEAEYCRPHAPEQEAEFPDDSPEEEEEAECPAD